VQQLITRQCEALSPAEQQLLRVASVAGRTFTAAEVAGVVGHALEDVEAVYDTLATREYFIAGEGMAHWPDGTVTGQYAFRHALYQRVLYEQVGPARRVRLHRQLGARKEAGYGDQTGHIAAELAEHFTQGRDASRAARYHGQAGETAWQRSAYRAVIEHCQAGLTLLAHVPDTPARQRQELALRMLLAGAFAATQGFSAADLVQNLFCAQGLCQTLHDDATLVSVVVALGRFYDLQGDRDTIAQHTDEKLRLLDRVQETALALPLHTHLGTSYLFRGQHAPAQAHHAKALALYDPQQHRELVRRFSLDPAVVAWVFSGASLWLAGWPDRARVHLLHGLHLAREVRHPYSLCMALSCASRVHLWCGALEEAERLAAEEVQLACEQGITGLSVQGRMQQACIHVQRGEPAVGLLPLIDGLAQYRGLGAPEALPSHLCFVADAYRQLGRVEEGIVTIAEAIHLTETLANVWWAAEVYRLKGELLVAATLQAASPRRAGRRPSSAGRDSSGVASPQTPVAQRLAEAEDCLHHACAIAHQQGAKSLELRAAMSLGRLWQWQGKHREAYELLAPIYGWFTEGFDTADLQEAKALLEAPGG
jgi:tetratricopeptide (TPR) repeat protein